jgi:muconolactone delta-isomerase
MKFMASLVTVHRPTPEELAELQPKEQARAKELIEQKILTAMFLAQNRLKGWLVVETDSLEAAQATIDSLPMRKFWEVEVTPLLDG